MGKGTFAGALSLFLLSLLLSLLLFRWGVPGAFGAPYSDLQMPRSQASLAFFAHLPLHFFHLQSFSASGALN